MHTQSQRAIPHEPVPKRKAKKEKSPLPGATNKQQPSVLKTRHPQKLTETRTLTHSHSHNH
ncbi:uncharacterized protein K452DRAFT_289706 [Aplosporella prunicola CBS 121167]|uniref:Uncharacterized protein n=1 Tax=Aplosporella prunicola CBS 121167 TaxID=1176127 RepID=A0A6A6B6I4_9PEZI|nr:uncharacterized protein K452DRAFT_289706 [Aplosporella prunicola CBS 121167]KAF2139719.1 hypothetical protein K452DRAFT_289706 [Aplosporella prunicola CBS 121167]